MLDRCDAEDGNARLGWYIPCDSATAEGCWITAAYMESRYHLGQQVKYKGVTGIILDAKLVPDIYRLGSQGIRYKVYFEQYPYSDRINYIDFIDQEDLEPFERETAEDKMMIRKAPHKYKTGDKIRLTNCPRKLLGRGVPPHLAGCKGVITELCDEIEERYVAEIIQGYKEREIAIIPGDIIVERYRPMPHAERWKTLKSQVLLQLSELYKESGAESNGAIEALNHVLHIMNDLDQR